MLLSCSHGCQSTPPISIPAFERLTAEEKAKEHDLQRAGKWRHFVGESLVYIRDQCIDVMNVMTRTCTRFVGTDQLFRHENIVRPCAGTRLRSISKRVCTGPIVPKMGANCGQFSFCAVNKLGNLTCQDDKRIDIQNLPSMSVQLQLFRR